MSRRHLPFVRFEEWKPHTPLGASFFRLPRERPYIQRFTNSLFHYPDVSEASGCPIDWRFESPRTSSDSEFSNSKNTLVVRGLPFGVTNQSIEERLRQVYSKFGPITRCLSIPHPRDIYQSSGTAELTFANSNSVHLALKTPVQLGSEFRCARLSVRSLDGTITKSIRSNWLSMEIHSSKQIASIAKQLYNLLEKYPSGVRLGNLPSLVLEERFNNRGFTAAGPSIQHIYGSWMEFLDAGPFSELFLVESLSQSSFPTQLSSKMDVDDAVDLVVSKRIISMRSKPTLFSIYQSNSPDTSMSSSHLQKAEDVTPLTSSVAEQNFDQFLNTQQTECDLNDNRMLIDGKEAAQVFSNRSFRVRRRILAPNTAAALLSQCEAAAKAKAREARSEHWRANKPELPRDIKRRVEVFFDKPPLSSRIQVLSRPADFFSGRFLEDLQMLRIEPIDTLEPTTRDAADTTVSAGKSTVSFDSGVARTDSWPATVAVIRTNGEIPPSAPKLSSPTDFNCSRERGRSTGAHQTIDERYSGGTSSLDGDTAACSTRSLNGTRTSLFSESQELSIDDFVVGDDSTTDDRSVSTVDNTEKEAWYAKTKAAVDLFQATKSSDSAAAKTEALKTFFRIVRNVVRFPEQSKYRRIRASNSVLRKKLTLLEFGQELLECGGFELNPSGSEWRISPSRDRYALWAEDVVASMLITQENDRLRKLRDQHITMLRQNDASPHKFKRGIRHRHHDGAERKRVLDLLERDKKEREAEARFSVPPSLHNASTPTIRNLDGEATNEDATLTKLFIRAPPTRPLDPPVSPIAIKIPISPAAPLKKGVRSLSDISCSPLDFERKRSVVTEPMSKISQLPAAVHQTITTRSSVLPHPTELLRSVSPVSGRGSGFSSSAEKTHQLPLHYHSALHPTPASSIMGINESLSYAPIRRVSEHRYFPMSSDSAPVRQDSESTRTVTTRKVSLPFIPARPMQNIQSSQFPLPTTTTTTTYPTQRTSSIVTYSTPMHDGQQSVVDSRPAATYTPLYNKGLITPAKYISTTYVHQPASQLTSVASSTRPYTATNSHPFARRYSSSTSVATANNIPHSSGTVRNWSSGNGDQAQPQYYPGQSYEAAAASPPLARTYSPQPRHSAGPAGTVWTPSYTSPSSSYTSPSSLTQRTCNSTFPLSSSLYSPTPSYSLVDSDRSHRTTTPSYRQQVANKDTNEYPNVGEEGHGGRTAFSNDSSGHVFRRGPPSFSREMDTLCWLR